MHREVPIRTAFSCSSPQKRKLANRQLVIQLSNKGRSKKDKTLLKKNEANKESTLVTTSGTLFVSILDVINLAMGGSGGRATNLFSNRFITPLTSLLKYLINVQIKKVLYYILQWLYWNLSTSLVQGASKVTVLFHALLYIEEENRYFCRTLYFMDYRSY